MSDPKQKHRPAPQSGYREQQDHRGQPGEDQSHDGRQIPEDTDQDNPKPREPDADE
jgi:hypothetical protein